MSPIIQSAASDSKLRPPSWSTHPTAPATAATPGTASLPGVHLATTCPTCHGTARNPEAPTEIADDDATCRVCCNPIHPWHAARHGQVRVPAAVLADPIIQARLAALAELA